MKRCRSDLNQSTIVRQLRRAGCSVVVVSHAAHGFDLLVGTAGVNYVVEVKQPGEKANLTAHERAMEESWRGSYMVVDSADDFLQQAGLIV